MWFKEIDKKGIIRKAYRIPRSDFSVISNRREKEKDWKLHHWRPSSYQDDDEILSIESQESWEENTAAKIPSKSLLLTWRHHTHTHTHNWWECSQGLVNCQQPSLPSVVPFVPNHLLGVTQARDSSWDPRTVEVHISQVRSEPDERAGWNISLGIMWKSSCLNNSPITRSHKAFPLDEKDHCCCQIMGFEAERNIQVKEADKVIKSVSFFLGNCKP